MKRIYFWLKIVVAISLIALLFWNIDGQQSLQAILTADPSFIAAAITINIVALLVSALRWQILLQAHRLNVPLMQTIRSYWMGNFASNYLPTNVGGDIIRIASLRHLQRTSKVIASVLIDRINGLAVLLCICLAIFVINPPSGSDSNLLSLYWLAIFALSVGVVIVITLPKIALVPFQLSLCKKITFINSFGIKIGKVIDASRDYRRHKMALSWSTMGSLIFYLCLALLQYYCLKSVGADLSFANVLLIAPLIPIVGLIPISLNGLGLVEGAFVAFYVAAGVPPTTALAAAIVRRMINTGISAVGAIFWLKDGPSSQST